MEKTILKTKNKLPEKFLHRNRVFKYLNNDKVKRGVSVGLICLITMIQLYVSTNAIVHCIIILVKVRHISGMFGRVMFVATASAPLLPEEYSVTVIGEKKRYLGAYYFSMY